MDEMLWEFFFYFFLNEVSSAYFMQYEKYNKIIEQSTIVQRFHFLCCANCNLANSMDEHVILPKPVIDCY